jgi:hypothetical protein
VLVQADGLSQALGGGSFQARGRCRLRGAKIIWSGDTGTDGISKFAAESRGRRADGHRVPQRR